MVPLIVGPGEFDPLPVTVGRRVVPKGLWVAPEREGGGLREVDTELVVEGQGECVLETLEVSDTDGEPDTLAIECVGVPLYNEDKDGSEVPDRLTEGHCD